MARPSIFTASAIMMLAITGCNEGGGGVVTPTPTPTPTPSPTPTPTPTPVPTVATFPLNEAREFGALSATLSFSGLLGNPLTIITPATLDGFADRVRLTLPSAVSASASVEAVIRENSEERRFNGSYLSDVPDPSRIAIYYQDGSVRGYEGNFSHLGLLNNSTAGLVTSDPAWALRWVSRASWWRGDSSIGEKRITHAIFGDPTAANAMPTTGSISYTMRGSGALVIRRDRTGSGVDEPFSPTPPMVLAPPTATVDYATGIVTIGFTLDRGLNGAGDSYTGTGTISPGTNRFTGTVTSANGAAGTFQGFAYGPQAAELGLTLAINNSDYDGWRGPTVGIMVGKKR